MHSICNGAIASFTDSVDGGTWTTSDTLVAPITTSGMLTARAVGNIYVLYSLPTGCAAVKAVAIDSTPQPVLGASTICNGSLQILVDSTQGGHWLSSNQSVAKINAAGYFVTQGPGFDTASYVLPNGCSSFLFVSVIPSPSAIDGNLNLCVGSVGTLTDSTGGGSWVSSNPVGVSISAAGVVSAMFQSVDTITYTANGCSTSAVVNVYPLPFTPVITLETPPSLCNGTMYQNFGTNSPVPDVQYSWSATGAQVWAQGSGHQYCLVNFENPGAAVVTLSTNYIGYSCYSSSSYTVSVSNTLSETVGLAYFENNFYCLNNDVSSYQWGYDVASTLQPVVLTGETNQNYYNPLPDLANKYYWVEVVSPDGCTQKTYWNTPLGIINQNPVATAGMLLYPNPTEDGSFRVEIPGAEGTAQVVVTDVLGNTVFNGIESLYNHQCPVVLKGAAAGVYMVKADAGDRVYASRIVVK